MVANNWQRQYADSSLFLTRSLQDDDFWSVLNRGRRRVKTLEIMVEFFYRTYFPKNKLINCKTRYLLRFNFTFWQISVNISLLASENCLPSFMYSFLWFLFYTIWAYYAILIMYLLNLKSFVSLNFCFKFFKSSIAPCNAVNSDYTFIKRVSYVHFVVCLQIHPLDGDIMNSKLFLMHCLLRFASHRALIKFLVHYIASAWVYL